MESGYKYNRNEEMDLDRKCGFESIYSALYCEYPEILEHHNITNIRDLYELVLNENDNKAPILETYIATVSSIMSSIVCPDNKSAYLKINEKVKSHLNKLRKNIKDGGGVYHAYFYFISLYFNIHINICYKYELVLNERLNEPILVTKDMKKLTEVLSIINKYITNPFGKITINYYPSHVYYEPLNKSKKIKDRFAILKKHLDSVRFRYQIKEDNDWIEAMTRAYEEEEDDGFFNVEDLIKELT